VIGGPVLRRISLARRVGRGVILECVELDQVPVPRPRRTRFRRRRRYHGEVGAKLQKIYAYGLGHTFGLACDPIGGSLWDEQNGEDSFDEINRVEPGKNEGWVQFMGAGLADRSIQVDRSIPGARHAPEVALAAVEHGRDASRIPVPFVHAPGSRYSDPAFSWKYSVAPAGIGVHVRPAARASI
jgi:hypothetical protein